METKTNVSTSLLAFVTLAAYAIFAINIWNWFLIPLARTLSITYSQMFGVVALIVAVEIFGRGAELRKIMDEDAKRTSEEKEKDLASNLSSAIVALILAYAAKILLGL